MKSIRTLPHRIWRFYYEGFRSMTIGKVLWAIILLKLFVFFFVLKLFFFPNLLQRDFDNDADRAAAVRERLTPTSPGSSVMFSVAADYTYHAIIN